MKTVFILFILAILVSGCVVQQEPYRSGPDNRYKTIIVTNLVEREPSFYDNIFPNDQAVFFCSIIDQDNVTYKVHYKKDCEKVKIGETYRTERNYRNDYIILILDK